MCALIGFLPGLWGGALKPTTHINCRCYGAAEQRDKLAPRNAEQGHSYKADALRSTGRRRFPS
jgi:hypothetical protein